MPPWVLVSGSFHRYGGMDKANAALAEYLAKRGTTVHLVAHHADAELAERTNIQVHLVPRPLGSFFLGEWDLSREGRRVAGRVLEAHPRARVLVNGGNCDWPDLNWVHSVHHAWACVDHGAPVWFKAKNRIFKSIARKREARAIRTGRSVLANSERTRRDLIDLLGIEPERVHTVHLGSDPNWGEATPEERQAARAWLRQPETRPLVAFVGALGHDHNKGFDTMWAAWRTLCAKPEWDADLVVAGAGSELPRWERRVSDAGLSHRVRFLGFTQRVPELLAAADLLVSVSRYDAYGLNVQEAICRGTPALVSGSAGVAERYPPELVDMVLADPESVPELTGKLLRWRSGIEDWKHRFSPVGEVLRSYTWADMAERIVDVARISERV